MYQLATTSRNWCYDHGWLSSYASTVPVISVGNLTVGGNGKTPLCLAIARGLNLAGWRPAILSRGYKGRLAGPVYVSTMDPAVDVGDEALVMARAGHAAVIVARNRVAGAQWIVKKNLANIIILDDGLQHRQLRRQLDILAVDISSQDSIQSFIEGKVLPFGAFRENRERGIARIHAVVFTCRGPRILADLPPKFLSLFPPNLPQFMSFMRLAGVTDSSGQQLAPQAVAAFCGLRNPNGFFETLRQSGYSVEAEVVFADHHPFSKADIDSLHRKYPGRPLVCTQKDWVKLEPQMTQGIYVLKAETDVEPWDNFMKLILAAIEKI